MIPQNAKTSIPEKFLNPLYFVLKNIEQSLKENEVVLACLQLEELALYLERNYLRRLNYRECILPCLQNKPKIIAEKLLFMMTLQPMAILDRRVSHWSKRIYCCLFLTRDVPLCLQAAQVLGGVQRPQSTHVFDWIWN